MTYDLSEVISRDEAKSRGLVKFNSARPCKKGHTPIRYARNGECVECVRVRHNLPHNLEKRIEYRENPINKEKMRDHMMKYRSDPLIKEMIRNTGEVYRNIPGNKEKLAAQRALPENQEKILEYRSRPEVKERALVTNREYRASHVERLTTATKIRNSLPEVKAKQNARNKWREAGKLQRTPTWADKNKIKEFYELAQKLTDETGVQHHVDHIIPLNGKLVSGFHVETNLRVVTAHENLSKNNKLIEELL